MKRSNSKSVEIVPGSIAAAVMLGLLHKDGHHDLTGRERRGIAIASSFALRDDGRDWYVRSQSEDREYRIRRGACPCQDDVLCKHLIAVEILGEYARELARRVDRDEWDGTVEDARALHDEYADLLQSASGYAPPPDGLLFAFRLEAIGDDAWQAQRQARLAGQPYVPGKLRDMHPERPWVAHINGLCPRYEFRRGFLRGKVDYREADKRGKRGVYLYFYLPPGIYEISERLGYSESRRYFALVADLTMTKIGKREVLAWLAGKPS